MSQAPRAVDLTVRGGVQGVGYRMNAAEAARRVGVTGWVRNASDGSVRAHAEGSAEAVEAFVAWCRTGPTYASVESVDETSVEPEGLTSFTVEP